LFDLGRTEVACAGARFILIERWAPGPLIGYLGMNPSVAGAQRSDPSFKRFNGFAHRWGFGGTIWANLLPFQSSDPDVALQRLREALRDVGSPEDALMIRNLQEIAQHAHMAAVWLAGWGNGGETFAKWAPTLIREISDILETSAAGRTWPLIAFGLTGELAAPKHVLARGVHRIPDDAPVYTFDPLLRSLGKQVPMPWGTP
jgi:hypothetical protein